jgi:hypothetical protein
MKLSTQPIDQYTSGLLKESDERVENIEQLLSFAFLLVSCDLSWRVKTILIYCL